MTQERLQLQCAQHDAQDAKNRKNEQKEMFEEAYNEVKNQAAMAVADKEQAQQQADELVRENQVLQQKWQHAEQRARMLEEKMVGLKRGRESPLQRSPSPARPLEPQHQPPMHGQATGQPQMFSPLRAQSGLLPQQSPFSPTHQRSRLGVSSAPINPSPSLRHSWWKPRPALSEGSAHRPRPASCQAPVAPTHPQHRCSCLLWPPRAGRPPLPTNRRQQTPLLHQRLSSPSLRCARAPLLNLRAPHSGGAKWTHHERRVTRCGSHTPRTDLRGQRPGGLSVSGLGRTSF